MTKNVASRRRPAFRPIPKGRQLEIHRDEFDRLIDMLNERGEWLNRILRDQEIQFQRIAQLQAELDLIKQTLTKLALT